MSSTSCGENQTNMAFGHQPFDEFMAYQQQTESEGNTKMVERRHVQQMQGQADVWKNEDQHLNFYHHHNHQQPAEAFESGVNYQQLRENVVATNDQRYPLAFDGFTDSYHSAASGMAKKFTVLWIHLATTILYYNYVKVHLTQFIAVMQPSLSISQTRAEPAVRVT